MERTKTTWEVTLQREDGQTGPYKFSTYWDPEADDAKHQVLVAAAAQAYVEHGKQARFVAIDATRVED